MALLKQRRANGYHSIRYKISSSLPLQMLLFTNLWLLPVWTVIITGYYLHRYHLLTVYSRALKISCILSYAAIEAGRIYLGYSGNLNEKVPSLVGFMMLIMLPQIPLLGYILWSTPTLEVYPAEYILTGTMAMLLIVEWIYGIVVFRRLVKSHLVKLQLWQLYKGTGFESKKVV